MVVEAMIEILTEQCVKTCFSSNLFLSGPLMEDSGHSEGRFFSLWSVPTDMPRSKSLSQVDPDSGQVDIKVSHRRAKHVL